MINRMTATLAFVVLGSLSIAANAQGHRPSGAGAPAAAPGGFGGPTFGAAPPQFDRGQAAARRAEADANRLEGEAHDRSAEARAQHPPNEHAADAATLAEQNADHAKSDSAKTKGKSKKKKSDKHTD